MSRGITRHESIDVQIEQMLARGDRSRAWICDRLGCTPDYIDDVIDRQNAACTQDTANAVTT